MGNTTVIIYENSHRGLEELVKGTLLLTASQISMQAQHVHSVSGGKSARMFYISKSQIQSKLNKILAYKSTYSFLVKA